MDVKEVKTGQWVAPLVNDHDARWWRVIDVNEKRNEVTLAITECHTMPLRVLEHFRVVDKKN